LGLAPAPSFQVQLVPSPSISSRGSQITAIAPPAKKESFLQRLIGEDPISELRVPLESYSFDRRGLFTVALANGEIWSQLDTDHNLAHWGWPARNHYVNVHGDLSEANLEVQDESGVYKVQRLH
jgi:hypothetical protein